MAQRGRARAEVYGKVNGTVESEGRIDPPQPSLAFTPSPFYRIPDTWVAVLMETDPLPHPIRSSLFFYLHPFYWIRYRLTIGYPGRNIPTTPGLMRRYLDIFIISSASGNSAAFGY